MPKHPTETEFVWQSEHRLKHKPTDAWWAVYPSGWPSTKGILCARQRTPDGEEYSLEELDRMAEAVTKRRFPQ
jgi:hypothetical protein